VRRLRPSPRPRVRVAGLTALVLVTACTGTTEPDAGDAAPVTEDDAGDADPDGDSDLDAPEPEPEPEPVDCARDALSDEAVVRTDASSGPALADELVLATHACATTVVLADDQPWTAAAAASLAAAEGAPLLVIGADGRIPGALTKLAPEVVLAVGPAAAAAASDGAEWQVVHGAPDGTAADGDGADGDRDAGDGSGDDDTTGDDDAEGDDDTEGTDGVDGGGDAASEPQDDDPAATGTAAAVAVAAQLGTTRFVGAPTGDPVAYAIALGHAGPDQVVLPIDADDPGASMSRLPEGASVVLPEALTGTSGLAQDLEQAGADAGVEVVPASLPVAAGGTTTWLVDGTAGAGAAVATAIALGRDEAVHAVDGADLRRDRGAVAPLRESGSERIVLVGDVTDDAEWQLTTLTDGTPLPWGGFSLFDDERMVALYGSPQTAALGVLGEQDLDATVPRLREVAEPYGADGMRVLPAFEIITTIASAEAGARGDYSRRTPMEVLRPWVDRAAEEGVYVILDLQPGRTDFLTQAQEYEDLLREPHVGLALDPEWRLGPDQVHLRQIGSVAPEEVQQVADWLAELTREEALPQKLLVLHQFRFSMLPDRESIEAPTELAVVVHMDGQGPIGTKYETYAAITGGHEDRWLWGWKNFYDEDIPTPTPAEVLALDPVPVFVSYQ
jgi:hypothetical protein